MVIIKKYCTVANTMYCYVNSDALLMFVVTRKLVVRIACLVFIELFALR